MAFQSHRYARWAGGVFLFLFVAVAAIPVADSLLGDSARLKVKQSPLQDPDWVIRNFITLCMGGGRIVVERAGVGAGADFSLRSFSAGGSLMSRYEVETQEALGLVAGLSNAMSETAADQVDKVRVCLEPLRARLIELLDASRPSPTPPPVQDENKGDRVSEVQCRKVDRVLTTALEVSEGSCFTNRDGSSIARVKTLYPDRIIYQTSDGKDETCGPGDRCSFGWPQSPVFHVVAGVRSPEVMYLTDAR